MMPSENLNEFEIAVYKAVPIFFMLIFCTEQGNMTAMLSKIL